MSALGSKAMAESAFFLLFVAVLLLAPLGHLAFDLPLPLPREDSASGAAAKDFWRNDASGSYEGFPGNRETANAYLLQRPTALLAYCQVLQIHIDTIDACDRCAHRSERPPAQELRPEALRT